MNVKYCFLTKAAVIPAIEYCENTIRMHDLLRRLCECGSSDSERRIKLSEVAFRSK